MRFTALGLTILVATTGCGGNSTSPSSQTGQVTLADAPEIKAAMEFASAQAFEKSRKPKQALDAYRHIIKEYASSPQAKLAAERIKALGGK